MFHVADCNYSCTTNANDSCKKNCHDGDDMRQTLADRIKSIRIAAGDSPAQVGKWVGVSRQAVDKWERGDTENMKLGNLLRFCDHYHVNVEALIRGEGEIWASPADYTLARAPANAGLHANDSAPREYRLHDDERRVIAGYRQAAPAIRKILIDITNGVLNQ